MPKESAQSELDQSGDNSQKQFRELINNSIENMIVISTEGLVLYLNTSARRLFPDDANNLINTPITLRYQAVESREPLKAATKITVSFTSLLANSKETAELVILPEGKEKRLMEVRATRISWDNHQAFLIALHDITDIKRVAELKAEIQEKSRVEKLKDELIGIISHEMRTPLTIIKSAVANLLDGVVGPLSEKQLKVVMTTNRNVDRLSRIINNLLDISRLESGKAKMNRRRTNLADVVNEIITTFSQIATENVIALTAEITEDIPPVYADPDMMMQVLTNLVNNALRYAKKRIVITVQTVSAETAMTSPEETLALTDLVSVSVHDDGNGIAPENLEKIFDKFQQIGRPSGGGGYKGTGLGLAICKEIISLHSGKILAESPPGQGATVTFTLPPYDENDEFLEPFERTLTKAENTGSNLAVLVVSIANMGDIMDQCAEKDIAWMLGDISREIRNHALRKSDVFYFRRDRKEFVLICSDTDAKTADVVRKRIHNLTRDCFCPGKTGKIYIALKTGMAVYPDDARTAKDLVRIAIQACE